MTISLTIFKLLVLKVSVISTCKQAKVCIEKNVNTKKSDILCLNRDKLDLTVISD